jgi:hypothetical protein
MASSSTTSAANTQSTTSAANTSSTTPILPKTPTANTFVLPSLTPQISKLDGQNYLSWVQQFLPFLKSHDLLGIVDGTEPCPAEFLVDDTGKPTTMVNPQYSVWQKKDQYLLSWFNTTMSETVMSSVYGLNIARQVWTSLSTRFASQSRSRVAYLKRQLQSLNQGSRSCSEFLSQAKSWVDQLTAARKPVEEDDLLLHSRWTQLCLHAIHHFIQSFYS